MQTSSLKGFKSLSLQPVQPSRYEIGGSVVAVPSRQVVERFNASFDLELHRERQCYIFFIHGQHVPPKHQRDAQKTKIFKVNDYNPQYVG